MFTHSLDPLRVLPVWQSVHWFEADPLHSLQEKSQISQVFVPGFSNLFIAVQASLHSVPSRYLVPVQVSHSVVEGPVHVLQVPSQASQVLVAELG